MAEETTKTQATVKTGPVGRAALVLRPVYSSKSAVLAKSKQYVFAVKLSANKPEIAKEIEKRYGVKVQSINTVRVEGKARTFGRFSGKTSDYKKAIVTLKKDSKGIELFSTTA